MRGRRPAPPELRVIKGDRRVRGKAVVVPLRPAEGEPAMPAHFDAAHQARWVEVTGLMREMGTLGREVGDLVALYVEASVEAAVARRHVAEHGAIVPAPRTGVPMHNPHRAIARQAEASMLKLAAELGLTPSSRNRITPKGNGAVNRFTGHGRRA